MTGGDCPWCHTGVLATSEGETVEVWHTGYHIVATGRGLEHRERRCVIAACNACEFVVEVDRRTGRAINPEVNQCE